MKRIKFKIKLGIDIAMLIAFLVNVFTGFAIFFGFVLGGGRQYGGVTGFDISNINDLSARALYRFVHDWSGILFIILILVHLVLNWNTFWCYLRNTWKNRNTQKVEESCENI
ncbi:MAG: DUF4405 domain-containing protein [Actinobacteria bacterium]|nr:DUF4405 domain-containing protein [Actinomycetota bacterium]